MGSKLGSKLGSEIYRFMEAPLNHIKRQTRGKTIDNYTF